MIKFLDLYKQYIYLKKDLDKCMSEIIKASAFIGGKYIKKFEQNFSKFINIKYCIGVANGTDALEIAIESLNFKKNQEILVPSNSWISSAEAVTRNNLKVVFVDVSYDDFTIDVRDLEKKVTKKTCAIMAVHLFGHPCEMENIIKIAKKYKLKIIEDCAQAHGAKYLEKRVGTFGSIATFSFYPGKNLGAYGDAGAIVTNNYNLALNCRKISNHGGLRKHKHDIIGRNSRLDTLQSAILSVKLKHLNNFNLKRNILAQKYISELKENKNIILPKTSSKVFHVYHLFVIKAKNRNKLKDFLFKNNIATAIHYPKILPRLKPYKNENKKKKFKSEKISKNILSLPLHEMLEIKDIIRISRIIDKFYKL